MENQKYSSGKNYKVVAFCVSCFAGDEQTRLIQSAQKISREHGCRVVFFSTISDFYYDDVNDAGEKKIFDAVSVERFDAIVLMAESFKKNEDMAVMVERARQAGVQVLAVDKRMDHCINLRYDYGDSFKEVVRHMIEFHGYRDVNFMAGFENNPFSDERVRAYREVLEENGIPFEQDRVYYGGFWEDPAREAMDRMATSGKPLPRAIICANDSMALAVSCWLREHDYRVPEDVAVSGFDGIVMERYHRPRLTTAITNYEGMLTKVFELIENEIPVEQIEDTIKICNTIQVGSSCGCQELSPIDPGTEMVNLKNQLYLGMRFHDYMNQMVANLGNVENLETVIRSVPDHMTLIPYKRFWLCVNMDFRNYIVGWGHSESMMKQKTGSFTDEMGVISVQEGNQEIAMGRLQFGELIPDLGEMLDEEESLMVVPMHLRGEVVGYGVVQFDVEKFTYSLYSSFAVNLRYLMEMQRDRIKITDMYMRDSLTGLYNRNGFYDLIRKVMEKDLDQDLAIVSIDMDHLKMVNDTYGHAEGDVALRHVAQAMESVIQEQEIAARIGGDEFLIAVSGTDVEDRAEFIKQQLSKVLREYNKVSEKPYTLQVSVGVYTNRIQGHTLDHFLKKADNLMYAEKYLHRRESGNI